MALTVFLFIATLQRAVALQLSPVIIAGSGADACPSDEERENARLTILNNAMSFLNNYALVPECGDGLWYRVAYLNMTDPTQQCPSAWRLYDTSGVRACGRPDTIINCSATFYPTGCQYNKVCGRVIGYQKGSPDAFVRQPSSIDEEYMDGVSITHGSPRTHIWTLAAGVRDGSRGAGSNCPCSGQPEGKPAPSFVGNNYYCETGNSEKQWKNQLYRNDPLWDGQQCEGRCCSDGKSPPWFSVELSNTTTDDIEVRICGNESTNNEDTPIQLMEIYVC